MFGAIFAAVSFVAEYASEWFGASGMYTSAFLSGLADVDATTITPILVIRTRIDGTRVAAVTNAFVEAALAWLLDTRMGRLVAVVLGVFVPRETGCCSAVLSDRILTGSESPGVLRRPAPKGT